MDWIKKNYDQFTLAIAAVALIGTGAMVFSNLNSFGDQFAEALATPNKNNQIQEVNTGVIGEARERFNKPTVWTPRKNGEDLLHSGLLFTSELYYVKDKLEKPGQGSLYNDSATGTPIPNKWFISNALPLLDPSVVFQDPDQDGFLNEDEFRANTDPNNKESHPPYHSKLFFAQLLTTPFRLKYQADDGDPKQPEGMTFQINPLDAGGRTKFVKYGETIEGTKFKVSKYEHKEKMNAAIQENEDVSELTVENIENGEKVILIKNKVVDSPNRFAKFSYLWNKKPGEAGQEFVVPRLKEFVLQPVVDKRYKLLDVTESGALIQTPDGQQYQVPLKK